jgi:uncharacterized SAM-binding protein YcdF (DUF218 family)
MIFFRLIWKIALAILGCLLVYEAITFVQVWRTSTRDEKRPAEAIVVFGAAQYNGRPSPVLRARLDHAAQLWQEHLAPVIVVTGGRAPGDQFTEATASANYLMTAGIPDKSILREVAGRDSWHSLASASQFLRARGMAHVILVSDGFHSARIKGMARELHLEAVTSPTMTSPIQGSERWKHMAKETLAVSVAQVVGYRRIVGVDRAVTRVRAGPTSG